MNTRIEKWFLNSDEKFLTSLRDEQERMKHLQQLYQTRIKYFFTILILLALMLIFGLWSPDGLGVTLPFLMVLQALAYLEVDAKIKIIKLHELLSGADQKSQ